MHVCGYGLEPICKLDFFPFFKMNSRLYLYHGWLFNFGYLDFNDLIELGFSYWFELVYWCWAWGLNCIIFGLSLIFIWLWTYMIFDPHMGSRLLCYLFGYLGFGLGLIWGIEMGFKLRISLGLIFILFDLGFQLTC